MVVSDTLENKVKKKDRVRANARYTFRKTLVVLVAWQTANGKRQTAHKHNTTHKQNRFPALNEQSGTIDCTKYSSVIYSAI